MITMSSCLGLVGCRLDSQYESTTTEPAALSPFSVVVYSVALTLNLSRAQKSVMNVYDTWKIKKGELT